MTHRTWFVTLLVLAAAVTAVDYFFVNVLFPHKKKMFLAGLFAHEKKTLSAPKTWPSGAVVNYEALPASQADNFKVTLQECLSDNELTSSSSPKELLEKLEARHGIKARNIQNEILQFKTADGEIRKLQIMTIAGSPSSVRELHLFKITPEGLPMPIDLDPALTKVPNPEAFQSLLKETTITFHNLKETILFNDDVPVIVDWTNEEPSELQMVGDAKTFSCHFQDCTCK